VLTDAAQPLDSTLRGVLRQRLVSDALAATDTATRALVRSRLLSDSVQAYDLAESARFLARLAQDALDASDALSSFVVFGQVYGTRIRIGVNAGAVLGSSRTMTAVIGQSEQVITLGGFNAQ
jgi:hypothetical protein